MKKISSCIVLLFMLSCFSQQKTTTVVYNYSFHFDDYFYSQLNQDRKNNFKDAEKLSSTIKPKLIFNDSISVFYSENIMDFDNKTAMIIAKSLCDCINPIFTKIIEQINYSQNIPNPLIENNKFLLFKKVDSNWTFHNESKFINDFLCYKATQKITNNNANNLFINNITAWYCPEFPYSIGPKGYGGLPGLIFELHEKEGTYGIESISLHNSSVKINIPTNIKLMSYYEYYETIHKKSKEITNEYQKD